MLKIWQKKLPADEERRKYIRLDTVFPVSFKLLNLEGKDISADWLQGFTNNIGKGGICLCANNLSPGLILALKNRQAKVSLKIEMPLMLKATPALAKVSWLQEQAGEIKKYLIGLHYEQISPADNKRIMRYAWTKKIFFPAVLTIIIILGLAVTVNTYLNIKLIKGNKALVAQLVDILQEASITKQKVKDIARERGELQLKIQTLQSRIKAAFKEKADLEEKDVLEKIKSIGEINELNKLVDKLDKEKYLLQEQLITIQHKENALTEEFLRLDKKKTDLEKANLDKMYVWLKVHQNPVTGLVMSFEGDGDIANWAFTYDQSLALQAYVYFGDLERAKKILNFFKQKIEKTGTGFLNAYYASDGNPAEYSVHSGPNIWLGIAIMQYTKKSADNSYFYIAEYIANKIIELQNKDSEGGIKGGPQVSWYSTEHNLDAYVFFNMLHKVTQNTRYLKARDRVLNWLVNNTYSKTDIPIKRGKGDSTIATDTYAWAIAAIGPEKLNELGMNPDRILEFAEKNCVVEVLYRRPEGNAVKLKGFDFAAQRHLARGGVVSSEWTAQMILSFKIMEKFYRDKEMPAKAHAYDMKADEYMAELAKMIISSPSPSGQGESCIPYATEDFVDTGHGWMTPKGKSTGSVSATAYTLFAFYNYNPLESH